MLAHNVLQYDYALHNHAILPLSIAAGGRIRVIDKPVEQILPRRSQA